VECGSPFYAKMAHRALLKRTSDHCRTAEFLIKACWKEDAHVVAREPQKEMAIESSLAQSSNSMFKTFTTFCNFLSLRYYQCYGFTIIVILCDI